VVVAALTSPALAQDQPPASFIRTHFTPDDGLPGNVVDVIAQTPDGFLWMITAGANLVRFDGHTFYRFDGRRSALVAAPAGGLWIGSSDGLIDVPQRDLNQFAFSGPTTYRPGPSKESDVTCLRVGRGGVLWVGTHGGLFRYDGARFTAFGPRVGLHDIEETPERHVFLMTEIGFVELDESGSVVPHPGLAARLGVKDTDIFHVLEDRRGSTWYSTAWGLERETDGRIEKLGTFGPNGHGVLRTYEDAEGTIWVAKPDEGLFRATAAGLESIAPGLIVRALFSDRDGNLWVGTNGDGLYRFKRPAVRMYTKADGLPGDVIQAVMTARDGTLWAGVNCGGLARFDGTRFQTYNEHDGLSNGCVWALAEDASGDLWVGTWGGGVFRFHNGAFTQLSKKEGLEDDRVTSVVAARDGTVWLGTRSGVSRLTGGQIHNFGAAEGFSGAPSYHLVQDRAGVLWAGSRHGLYRFVGDRFERFPAVPTWSVFPIGDLPGSGFLVTGDESNEEMLRIDKDRVDTIAGLPRAHDFVETTRGDLWLSAFTINRVPPGELIRSRALDEPRDYETFSTADGLAVSEPNTTPGRVVALTPDGRVWVATTKGLAMFDLGRLPGVATKPSIYVTDVTIGRKTAYPVGEIVLPAGTNHLQVDFGAVEISSPEKIRMQYRLDDVDTEWLDAGRDPHAIYSTLSPGTHVLRIRACNRSGIWDRQGVVFSITQQPFFYQTRWFMAAMWISGALFVVGVYRLRVRQMSRAMSARFEERLTERARIARDLHDTLLQSFQGLVLRFQAVMNLLPDRAADAKQQLERAIDSASDAIAEGRDAVQNLRASTVVTNDLAAAIAALGRELTATRVDDAGASPPALEITVEGASRDLNPIVRDDVYRIAAEAIRNAFRHARARRIDVHIRYDDRTFELHVRDDGMGMDRARVDAQRLGHFGLAGMRERAERVGGHLEVSSEAGLGTRIELSIPAAVAFAERRRPKRS